MAQSLKECKKKGYWLLGMDSNTGTPLTEFDAPFPAIIVLGNEHKGLSQIVSKSIHTSIKIPMKGQVDSFNVSVSAGIALHHLSHMI